jgi:uncharacterized protein YjiK
MSGGRFAHGLRRAAAALALLGLTGAAQAAASIRLDTYQLSLNTALPTLGGMGLEASAVAYARDRGSLFFVGDEGLGVVEVSRSGVLLGSMAFGAWPTRTQHNDAEGLAYLGNGVLVVGEERLQDAFRFGYSAGGSVDLNTVPWVSVVEGWGYNNSGMEGIAYDSRGAGSWVAVKQANPQRVMTGTLSFEADADGGSSAMTQLYGGTSLFGLGNLADVAVLSGVDALVGTPAADNLLLLSLASQRLIEVDRQGNLLSSIGLSSFTPNAIEGVTIDEHGTIYLVAEDSGFGASRLLVLSPVPEPQTWGLMLTGLLALAAAQRRRSNRR